MAGYGYNTGLDGHRVTPLTEKEIEDIAEGVKEVYGWARERMLTSVAERFSNGRIGYGWAEKKASEITAAHAQLERDMDLARAKREGMLSGLSDRAAMTASQKFYTDVQGMLGDVAHISPNSAKAAYILADLNNSLDVAERRILRQFDDRYADVIAAVSSELSTGVMTEKQAVGDALKAFADQGITGFVDRGGHSWTLENYSEMATLTAIERATLASYVDTMQSYGFDLAVIDGHGGSCPICRAWEGVIVSVSGNDPDYPSLTEAEDEGVFHPRCIHGISTYYPGITHEPKAGFRHEPREVEPPEKAYTARSEQRYMERQIRKYKDRLIVAQTAQQRMMARNKVIEWTQALDELIAKQPESNYLYRHRDRESSEFSKRFSDISSLYTGLSTPGTGTVSLEEGYSDPSKGHETRIAEQIVREIGGDVKLINNVGRVTKPDMEWCGKSWELKNTSSLTSVDTQTRKGLDQISRYHGNLIVDNTGLDFERYQEAVLRRIERSAKEDCDVLIFYNGEYVKTLEYKKR